MEDEAKRKLDELRRKIEQNSAELKRINEEKELKYKEKNKLDKLLFSFIRNANEIRDKKTKTDTIIRQLKKSREGLNAELKNLFSGLKFFHQSKFEKPKVSPENIKKQIDAIQFSIETEALSFEREKAYMEKIRALKTQFTEIQKTLGNIKDSRISKKDVFDKKKVADETHEKIIDLATESSKDFETLTDLSRKISDIKTKKSEMQISLKNYKEKIDSLNQELETCLTLWSEIAPQEPSIKKPIIDVISKLKEKKSFTKDDILELQRKAFRQR
ncbi:MAG: hypothetical protein AABW84_01085 [Nanoarchaeota archaeon]